MPMNEASGDRIGRAAAQVVTCPGHVGHAPSVEVACGVPVDAYDKVERMDSILTELRRFEWVRIQSPSPHGIAPIRRVHSGEMVSFLSTAWSRRADRKRLSVFADTFLHASLSPSGALPYMGGRGASSEIELGRFCFDTITGVQSGTFHAALASASTAVSAAALLTKEGSLSVALCRPPGHHVGRTVFGGGCFFNNAAIAAQWLRDNWASRVAILDLDFHHGNGTQQIFYRRSDVLYISLHGHPERTYPYFTGWPSEIGEREGRGYNENLTLSTGTLGPEYCGKLARAMDRIREFEPSALVVSLGFDTFLGDPLGDAALETVDYFEVGRLVATAQVPIVAILEGGYVVSYLGGNLSTWIQGVMNGSG